MVALETLYNDVWNLIASSRNQEELEEAGPFALTPENLPVPSEPIYTVGFCMTVGYSCFDGYPVGTVIMECEKETIGKLGLLLLSAVFSRYDVEISLELRHPRTTITKLTIAPYRPEPENDRGLVVMPECFNYQPKIMYRHPWSRSAIDPFDLPILTLRYQDTSRLNDYDLKLRDLAVGFGGIQGTSHMAELMMNAGQPCNDILEYQLEGEHGFRGVGVNSPDMRIWLPGGLGHLDYAPIMD